MLRSWRALDFPMHLAIVVEVAVVDRNPHGSAKHRVQWSDDVKLVIAIIQPTKLKPVQEALAKVGVERMTVCDAQGFGRQRGQTELYRGVEYKTRLLRKIALEIAVNDDFLDRTLETIESVAQDRAGREHRRRQDTRVADG